MARLKEVIAEIEALCPPSLAESYDNAGLQVGDPEAPCKRILLALDFRPAILAEAVEKDVDLIITHHPLLFRPLRAVDRNRGRGRWVYRLIEAGVALYAMHTNLDKIAFGVNGVLAEKLGLSALTPLTEEGPDGGGLGFLGRLETPLSLPELAERVRGSLGLTRVRYAGDAENPISRVAVLGGSGASMIAAAAEKGAGAFVSGDFKYHDADLALELGIGLVDGGHYGTEAPVLPVLAKELRQATALDVLVSTVSTDAWNDMF